MSIGASNHKRTSKGFWITWYVVVLIALLAEIAFFYWLTVENQ